MNPKSCKFTSSQPIILYRKITAEQIFTGYEMLPHPAVLITDQHGTVTDLVDMADAGHGIEHFKGILSPGFINCHCHLELSHMKGMIPKHTGLVDFLIKVVEMREGNEAVIMHAIENAETAMWKNGIVAVGDICNTNYSIPQKTKGRLAYHNFIEAIGFPPAAAETRFLQAETLFKQFAASLPHQSIVPHAPYSVSLELLNKIISYPGNDLLTMHNQEAAAENALFLKKEGDFLRLFEQLGIDAGSFKPSGTSSLQHVLPGFKNYRPLILVHNVFTSEEDIVFALSVFDHEPSSLYFCICANANLYIGNQLPDISLFTKHQCKMVLGTDSLASNDQLSIMEEIITLQKHFPQLAISELLQWATINGANALGISEIYGSFKKGKKPGVLQIDGTTVNRII